MLAISLMRMGTKGKPFYRVVVKEKRSKRDGKYLENVGTIRWSIRRRLFWSTSEFNIGSVSALNQLKP